jgi:flavodoxin
MNYLVAYYSKSGSNRYLAKRFAQALNGDIEEIRPRLNAFPSLALFSFLRMSLGIRRFQHPVNEYDRVVVVGPIWMGLLISPLRDFIRTYRHGIRELYFATCCGGGDEQKDTRFGYGGVFRQVKDVAGEKCIRCQAFPILMVIPEEKKKDDQAVMNTRLSDSNFSGEIKGRFDGFITDITGEQEPAS